MKELKKSESFLRVLSQTFLFENVKPEMVSDILFSPDCTCGLFEASEKVYTRNKFQKSMGIVVSGKLKAVKNASDGSPVIMNTFSSGGIFGVAGLFNHTKQYVSEIEAISRSKILFLSQALLHQLFLKEPQASENYIAFLSDRIYFLNTCIDHYTGGSAKHRLFSFLLSLPSLSSNPQTVELPCSMTRLADCLDIGRASLYRAFDELVQEGAIQRIGKQVIFNGQGEFNQDNLSFNRD